MHQKAVMADLQHFNSRLNSHQLIKHTTSRAQSLALFGIGKPAPAEL